MFKSKEIRNLGLVVLAFAGVIFLLKTTKNKKQDE
jgi:threonine/homoserine efflux transporter RhtA